MAISEVVRRYLDSGDRLVVLPAKNGPRMEVLLWLSGGFQPGREYSGTEVDSLLLDRHLFNDCCLLRRELVDRGFLQRTKDGRSYWRADPLPGIQRIVPETGEAGKEGSDGQS